MDPTSGHGCVIILFLCGFGLWAAAHGIFYLDSWITGLLK